MASKPKVTFMGSEKTFEVEHRGKKYTVVVRTDQFGRQTIECFKEDGEMLDFDDPVIEKLDHAVRDWKASTK